MLLIITKPYPWCRWRPGSTHLLNLLSAATKMMMTMRRRKRGERHTPSHTETPATTAVRMQGGKLKLTAQRISGARVTPRWSPFSSSPPPSPPELTVPRLAWQRGP